MKNLFSIIFLSLLFSVSLIGQHQGPALTGFVLETAFGANTMVNDSTFQVNCFHPASQLGFGYDATDIQVGHYGLDALNRLFRVDAIVGVPTFGTSVLRLVELQDNNLPPVGVCVIYEEIPGTNLIPMGVVDGGINGLTFPTGTKIFNHNIRELNRLIEEIPIESDSTRLESGILVSWKNGAIVRRDTLLAAYSRIEDIGNIFVAADNVEEALAENGSNIAANTLLISAVKDALGINFLDEDFGNFTNPILPDNANGKELYEALADAISAIPVPTLSSVLDAGNNAGGGFIEDLQLLSFGDGTVLNPVYLYDNSGKLVLGKSGQVDDLFEFNEGFDTDISVVRKQDLSDVFLSEQSTFYISPTGNNLTGEKGNRAKPYQSYYYVRDLLSVGDHVVFLTGLHLINYNADLDLSFNQTDWYISADAEVRIDPGSHNPVILMADGEYFKIYGPGKITFKRYFAVDLSPNTKFELSVDNVESIGYLFRSYQAYEEAIFRIKNLILTDRPFCRIAYMLNSSVTIDIDNIQHTNTNTGADYPVFLLFDAAGANGSILKNSTLSIKNNFVKTNATVFGINSSGANGSSFINNCDISVDLNVVDQTGFISRPYSGQSVASMGGSHSLTIDTTKIKISVGVLLSDQAVFNFAGASAFAGINATDSQILIDCSVSGKKNIVGSRDQVGIRNNLGTFTRSKLFYSGNSITTDSVAVQFGTGWNIELTGSVQANSVPIRSRSDILARSFLATNKSGGELIIATSPINLGVCSSNIKETNNVNFNDLCGYSWFSDVFTATAAQVDFEVSQSKLPSDSANIRVYDDSGAKLRLTDHYTYVPATGTVTLVTPATAGEKYVIEYYQ